MRPSFGLAAGHNINSTEPRISRRSLIQTRPIAVHILSANLSFEDDDNRFV